MERKENTLETVKVKTLDQNDLPWSEEEFKSKFDLIICDIDYTLVDFEPANQAGIRKLEEVFGERMGSEVDRIFQIVLEGNRKTPNEEWQERDEFNKIMDRIAKIQTEESKKKYGVKVWSRESYIIIAAENLGVKVNRETVERARDIYWAALGENYRLYSDAKSFLEFLKRLNIPLFLMTGSDAVLNVNEDLTLNYNPQFSKEYKMRRLTAHFPGIPVVVGDPIDKQYSEYFDYLSEEVKKIGNFSKERTLVVGDSEKADLMFPRARGYPTLLVPARR